MVLLRFGKRSTKKKVCLDDELKEDNQIEASSSLENSSPNVIAKQSPIADIFLNQNFTESTSLELGPSLLDDILKELQTEPRDLGNLSEPEVISRENTGANDVGHSHAHIPAFGAQQKATNGGVSLLSSLPQQQTTFSSDTKSSTIPSFIPIQTQLQQIQHRQQQEQEQEQEQPKKTPTPSSAKILADSDDSDDSSSDEASAPPLIDRKHPPQKRHARLITDTPKQVMNRMKERHRQECRRSISTKPFIIGHHDRFQTTTSSPSMPSLQQPEAPVRVPNLASSKSFNVFPSCQVELVRSASAASDFYRRHQMPGANQFHPPSMVHMQSTNRFHAFQPHQHIHQQQQAHFGPQNQSCPVSRPISILSDGGGVHPLSASKSIYSSLQQPARAQSPPLLATEPHVSQPIRKPQEPLRATKANQASASKQVAHAQASETVSTSSSVNGSMNGSLIVEIQSATPLPESKSTSMAPAAGYGVEQDLDQSVRGSSRSSSTSSDSTGSSKAPVTDDEQSVAPVPVMDPHYFLPARLKHQLQDMRTLKQSCSVPDLKELSQQHDQHQQQLPHTYQQQELKPTGLFAYNGDQSQEKKIAPMQPYPFYEDLYGSSMWNYQANPPWTSQMYSSPSMRTMMMMHPHHPHSTYHQSEEHTPVCHRSNQPVYPHQQQFNMPTPCCGHQLDSHPSSECHKHHIHHLSNHTSCQHHHHSVASSVKHCLTKKPSTTGHNKEDKKSSSCCKKHIQAHRHRHYGHHGHQCQHAHQHHHQHHNHLHQARHHQSGCSHHQQGHTRPGYSSHSEDHDSKLEQVEAS